MGLPLLVLGLDLFQLGDEFFFRDQPFLNQDLGKGITLNGIGYQEFFEGHQFVFR
jgi:hypothetical protein